MIFAERKTFTERKHSQRGRRTLLSASGFRAKENQLNIIGELEELEHSAKGGPDGDAADLFAEQQEAQ